MDCDWIGEERVELGLEHRQAAVETTGGEQLVDHRDAAALQLLREAAEELAPRLVRRAPADHLVELGEQQPAALRLDGERGA